MDEREQLDVLGGLVEHEARDTLASWDRLQGLREITDLALKSPVSASQGDGLHGRERDRQRGGGPGETNRPARDDDHEQIDAKDREPLRDHPQPAVTGGQNEEQRETERREQRDRDVLR